jgi:pyrrolysyl-tRNA synthetase-like protein
MSETDKISTSSKRAKKRYYRKRSDFFLLVDKIKLWPSRNGILHGIKSFHKQGDQAEVITHCNEVFTVRNSKNSRAARWLRNNWYKGTCRGCAVPGWKVEKYSSTIFNRHWGSDLQKGRE